VMPQQQITLPSRAWRSKDLDEERHLQGYTRRAHFERSISRGTGETTYIQRRKETGATERNYYDYYYCQLRRTGAAAAMQDPPRKKQQQRRRRNRDRQTDKEWQREGEKKTRNWSISGS
jgi:hypothetical protein